MFGCVLLYGWIKIFFVFFLILFEICFFGVSLNFFGNISMVLIFKGFGVLFVVICFIFVLYGIFIIVLKIVFGKIVWGILILVGFCVRW